MTPAARKEAVEFACSNFPMSLRRACGLMQIQMSSYYYRHRPRPDEALRAALKEAAAKRRRWGYRMLAVLMERQGFKDNLTAWYQQAEGDKLKDFAYGAESYDATILAALAAAKGGSNDSQTVRDNFAAVSGATGGEECTSYADCLALIQGLDPTHFDDPDPRIAIPVFEDGERLYQFWASDGALWLSLTLGSAAAVSASTAIRSAAERWRAEGSSVELLLDLAVASQVIANSRATAAPIPPVAPKISAAPAGNIGSALMDILLDQSCMMLSYVRYIIDMRCCYQFLQRKTQIRD